MTTFTADGPVVVRNAVVAATSPLTVTLNGAVVSVSTIGSYTPVVSDAVACLVTHNVNGTSAPTVLILGVPT